MNMKFSLGILLLFPIFVHAQLTNDDIVGKWDCHVPLTNDGIAVQEQIHLMSDHNFQGIRHQTVPYDTHLNDDKPFPIAFKYRLEISGKWALSENKLIISDYVPKNVVEEHDTMIQKWLNQPPEWLIDSGVNTLKVANAFMKIMLSKPMTQSMSFDVRIQNNIMKLTSQVTEYCQRMK